MLYDYSISGPCCEYRRLLRVRYEDKFRAAYVLIGGNSRNTWMLLEGMKRSGESLPLMGFALAEQCICHEHPNPPLFRRMVGKVLDVKKQGKMPQDPGSIERVLNVLAKEALNEVGETTGVGLKDEAS